MAHYQPWFFLYPTGEPPLVSARQLRDDLERVCQLVDPSGKKSASSSDGGSRPQRRSLHLLNYVDSPQFQRNIQRALNRGESYHKLVRAVAYANGGKLRVRTDQEQQLWSECSRLLANCIIYYNACILSELLERAERRQDYQRANAIKRANPASWKHVNLYGAYSFLDIGDGVVLQELVNLLEAARGRGVAASDRGRYFVTQIDISVFIYFNQKNGFDHGIGRAE